MTGDLLDYHDILADRLRNELSLDLDDDHAYLGPTRYDLRHPIASSTPIDLHSSPFLVDLFADHWRKPDHSSSKHGLRATMSATVDPEPLSHGFSGRAIAVPLPTDMRGRPFSLAGKSAYRRLLSLPSPRTSIPSSLLQSPHADPLNSSTLKAWLKTEPSQQSKDRVQHLLDTLNRTINSRYNHNFGRPKNAPPRFEMDVFGSVSWGGETGQSGDLDLVILVSRRP